MVLIAVTCPYCQSDPITKRGKTDTGKQRYRCPAYKGHLPEIKEQIIDMGRVDILTVRFPTEPSVKWPYVSTGSSDLLCNRPATARSPLHWLDTKRGSRL